MWSRRKTVMETRGPLAPEVFLEVRTRDLDGLLTAHRVALISHDTT